MENSVLYFPYIRVPRNVWFTRVLLYWDEIGSIVPSEYQRNRTRLGSYMSNLIEAGLVKEIVPSHYDLEIPEFRSAFLQLIDECCYLDDNYRYADEYKNTARIHIEKMLGSGLSYDLVQRGLAKPSKYPWFDVEITTANLFMGYLASVLGKLEKVRMCPITDEINSLSVFSSTPQKVLNRQSLAEQLRLNILDDILPSPRIAIPVKELLEFKQKYAHLLSSFRRYIEGFLIDISAIYDIDKKEERIGLFKEESSEHIDEIIARMHEKQWRNIVFGGICGIIAAAIPGITSVATGNEILAFTAIPGLITATYSAFQGKAKIQKQILSDPLAYAAYVHERLSSIK